jgi:hypothetical protein
VQRRGSRETVKFGWRLLSRVLGKELELLRLCISGEIRRAGENFDEAKSDRKGGSE